MTNPTINITACTDGLSPRHTSLYPDGDRPYLSGGTPALEWVTNGTLQHGELITVRTNVAGLFGEPDLRAQSLSMVGDETWVNGVSNPWLADYANNEFLRGWQDATGGNAGGHTTAGVTLPLDADSPFLGVAACVKNSFTRHANISSSVKMMAFAGLSDPGGEPGLFSWPKPFNKTIGRTPDAGKLCVATWTFYDFDNAEEMCRVRYSSITGTFQTGANSVPSMSGAMLVGGIVQAGERINLTSALGKVAQGNVLLVDTVNSWLYLFIDSQYEEWHTVYDWTGATITGVTSGATTTIPTYPAWNSGTTYNAGAIVYDALGNFKTSQQNGNIGNNPATQGDSTTWWAANNDVIRNEGALKNARILQHPNVGQVDTATVIAGVSGKIGINVFYDPGTGQVNDATDSAPIKPLPYQWHRRTIWVDYRPDANGKIMCGNIIDNNPAQVCLINAHNVRGDIGPILSNWGIEAPITNGHTSISAELKTYTDTMMCIVSSSPTWAGVDYLESEPLVRVGHRTSTEAQFKLSRGVYSSISGKYLYVLRDPMTPINTNGLLLTGA